MRHIREMFLVLPGILQEMFPGSSENSSCIKNTFWTVNCLVLKWVKLRKKCSWEKLMYKVESELEIRIHNIVS
jgi:hypothetical protein